LYLYFSIIIALPTHEKHLVIDFKFKHFDLAQLAKFLALAFVVEPEQSVQHSQT
jgi:hypothetical protein